MENIDELNAALLDAKVEMAAKSEDKRRLYKELHDYLDNTLKKNVDTSAVKVACSDSSARLEIGNLGIDLYFERPWCAEDGHARVLKINSCCFGSFDKTQEECVKYCETLGHVAGIMKELEYLLLRTDAVKRLWDAYDAASSAASRAANKVREIEGSIKSIEAELRKMKILAQVFPGCRIVVKKASSWHGPVIKTIEHITGKNIIFKEDWGRRTKKDELISNLMCSRWEIA